MIADLTGPALGGVEERWENKEDLYAWIRNSQSVIKGGNAYAISIYKEYNESVMTTFPTLTDEEIDEVLKYIDSIYQYR